MISFEENEKTVTNDIAMSKDLLYRPDEHDIQASLGWKFLKYVERHTGAKLAEPGDMGKSYQNLHTWSVENIAAFHEFVWDFCEILGDKGTNTLTNPSNIIEAYFFEDSKISFAENMLKRAKTHPEDPAIISRVAGHVTDRILSWKELYDQVSIWEQILEQNGIGEGDRISTYLPHIPEAYIIHIAAANLGAIFSSVGTEMGAEATADRFKQIQPKLLITVDGYTHITPRGEKIEDRLSTIKDLQDQVDSLQRTILIENLGNTPKTESLTNTMLVSDALKDVQPKEINFIRRDFNHPLAILFSSGSTGKPKCFVHGTGGIILKHAIEHQLQSDVRPGDREFYHTTTSWMMFNWLASALSQGASILIYDGNPAYPEANAQLKFAADHKCTHLGTAAGVIQDVWRANNVNGKDLDLSALKALSYTASVLSPEGYEYIHSNIKADMSINGICGGTDFVGCYAGGNSFMPTYAGQLKGPILGMAIQTWNENGTPVDEEEVGELVITKPFISRPLYFWGDKKTDQYPNGERFTTSYFTQFPELDPPVWHHGDAVRFFNNGQLIVTGRSDSTLNQNGVRIGSQTLYDALDNAEFKDEIVDSMAVNFKDNEGGDHTILFIVAAHNSNKPLTPELGQKIKHLLSDKVGRLCVPHEIMAVPYILKTPNGKKAEKPTKQLLAGETIKTPETYGLYNGTLKADLYTKIGASLRNLEKYGFAA